MVARSEKTHVFCCREIETMHLNLKKRLHVSPVAAGTRYQRHFKRLHLLPLLLVSMPLRRWIMSVRLQLFRTCDLSVQVHKQSQLPNFLFEGKKKQPLDPTIAASNVWTPELWWRFPHLAKLLLTAAADVKSAWALLLPALQGSDGPTAGNSGRGSGWPRTSAHIPPANGGFMSVGLLIFRWPCGWIKHDTIKGDARCPVWDSWLLLAALQGIRSSAEQTPDNDPETERDSKLCCGSSLICQVRHMLEIRALRSNALDSKFLAFQPNRFSSFFIKIVHNKRTKQQISKAWIHSVVLKSSILNHFHPAALWIRLASAF